MNEDVDDPDWREGLDSEELEEYLDKLSETNKNK